MENKHSRRQFQQKRAQAGLTLSPIGSGLLEDQRLQNQKETPSKLEVSLKTSILCRTSFLAPHQIKHTLSSGCSASRFTRGNTIPKTNPEVFKDAEQLIGNRKSKTLKCYIGVMKSFNIATQSNQLNNINVYTIEARNEKHHL